MVKYDNVKSVTPGQACVLYLNDECLGGGIIKEVRKYSNYDGKIVLMHSIYKSTAEAVKTIVPELIKKGYQLVTISEMAEAKGIKLQSGILYTEIK